MILNRNEMAAVKRTAQSTKPIYNELAKLRRKEEQIKSSIEVLENELKMWNSPIIEKWGHTPSEIIEVGGNLDFINNNEVQEEAQGKGEVIPENENRIPNNDEMPFFN